MFDRFLRRWGLALLICALAALSALQTGCAVLAGAAAGGATGYVAGHEAGEDEAHEEIHEHEHDHD